jgi:putative hydrolase of the HAD superfamily
MKSGITAVAFDLDGTLYPNYRLNYRLIPFILREWRLLWAFGRARDSIRGEQERQKDAPDGGQRSDFYDYQARLAANILGADSAVVKEKIDRLIYRGWEEYFKQIALFPHAAETLAALRQAGLKLGMLSDFPPEVKLEYLGLADYWDTMLCSERIGALKPARCSFVELAAALGTAPEQILYVGNSRRYDVAGALRAGMRAALITGRLHAGAAGPGVFAFHDYRQLREYVLS